MTTMDHTTPAPRPFRYTMLIPSLAVNVVAPLGLLLGLEAFGVSPIWALAAACVPPVLNNLRVWIGSRRLDPVGILIMLSMASGVAASLVSGDISYKVVADCLLNSAWGLAFLGSLLFARPAIFFMIRPLVTGEDVSRTETWNGLWRYAGFRSAMRSITATWGAVYFIQVLIELGLACVLTPQTVVTYAPLMGVAATLGLIAFTRFRMRTMRERLARVEHLTWPL